MSDYIVPRSVKRLEDEIAELEKGLTAQSEAEEVEEAATEEVDAAEETPSEPVIEDKPIDKEEETFKKRYSDLRRHSQKLSDRIKELEELVKQKSTSTLPSAEEAEEWAKSNPKAAAIIRALASQEANPGLSELAEIKEKLSRSEQEARIFKAHPDFEEITGQEEFHVWADDQPENVQKLIYSNTAEDVIWAISQYKKEKAKTPDVKKEAAKQVSSKSTTTEPKSQSKGRFTESMVSKMSMSEYEKNEAAIQQAMRDGTFVYDLSGAAR